eukprot:Platyproteum_vivax@DN16335_c0_g1_i1.p1
MEEIVTGPIAEVSAGTTSRRRQRPSPTPENTEYTPLNKPAKHSSQEFFAEKANRPEFWSSLVVVNSVGALDGCDAQLLPSTFRALEMNLGFTAVQLGALQLMQTLAASLSSPIWGICADKFSRKTVLAAGAFGWGVFTFILGCVSDFHSMAILRFLNGAAISSVGPVSQSYLADVIQPSQRGKAFGIFQAFQGAGRLLGALLATSLALVVIRGLWGWRFVFAGVGLTSVIASICMFWFMPELERVERTAPLLENEDGTPVEEGAAAPATASPWGSQWRYFVNSISIPSVLLLLTTGLFFFIPWQASTFLTIWLQYVGFTDLEASVLVGLTLLGVM